MRQGIREIHPPMPLIGIAVCLAIMFSGPNWASQPKSQAKPEAPGPREVVRNFCQLDADGARWDSETVGQVWPLVAWEEIPDTDIAVVISSFRIVSLKETGNKAIVTVKYNVLGTLGGEGFALERRSETIKFQLLKINGKWKIVNPRVVETDQPIAPANVYGTPIAYPHISLWRAREDTREQIRAIEKANDPLSLSLKPGLEDALRQLDALWEKERSRQRRQ